MPPHSIERGATIVALAKWVVMLVDLHSWMSQAVGCGVHLLRQLVTAVKWSLCLSITKNWSKGTPLEPQL